MVACFHNTIFVTALMNNPILLAYENIRSFWRLFHSPKNLKIFLRGKRVPENPLAVRKVLYCLSSES